MDQLLTSFRYRLETESLDPEGTCVRVPVCNKEYAYYLIQQRATVGSCACCGARLSGLHLKSMTLEVFFNRRCGICQRVVLGASSGMSNHLFRDHLMVMLKRDCGMCAHVRRPKSQSLVVHPPVQL